MNQDDKTMLALAALTYRGFGLQSEAGVDRVLRPWLPMLEAEGLGKWELVWGPATFRTPTSLFDDAMMYMARQARPAGQPARYAIAIRGTNPVSMFDWVFGDFWVRLPVDWTPAGNAPAQISASTALGMAIIQHLAAEVPPSAAGTLDSIANALSHAVADISKSIPEMDPNQLLNHPESLPDNKLIERIKAFTDRAGNDLRKEVFSRLSTRFGNLKALQEKTDRLALNGLLQNITGTQGRGETLLQFLNRAVGTNVSIAVTGHSKGGALAVATALWLAENWAPSHKADIDCFPIAGPTAGNAGFAQRYNARLAQRTRRIVNPRDIVPQAWVPEKLKSVAAFYPELSSVVSFVNNDVTPLGHTHVGGELVEVSSNKVPGPLAQQLIHHHLDAYLADAHFQSPKWKAQALFTGD